MIKEKITVNRADRQTLQKLFDAIKSEEGNQDIYICTPKLKRSKGQRGYYWKVIVSRVAAFCGYTKIEANEQLKRDYNPKAMKNHKGEFIVYGASIESEPPRVVEEINEMIRADFAAMDLDIPLPQKVSDEEYIIADQTSNVD